MKRAQLRAFHRQVPLLHFVLIVNCLIGGYVHYRAVPDWLSVWLPGLFTLGVVGGMIFWFRAPAKRPTDEEIDRRLSHVSLLSVVVGAVMMFWALALSALGTDATRSHMAFAIGLTVFVTTFCLMHLRRVALLLMAITVLPFAVFMLLRQNTTDAATAINLLLVSGTMVVILFMATADFEKMVNGRAELKRLSDDNARLATVDTLTELPNRRHFLRNLDQLLNEAHAHVGKLTVGVLDLDGFKPVNDLYGHVVGDQVLAQVAKRLTKVAGDQVFVARLGGDEFGLILPTVSDPDEIMTFGEAICAELQTPFETSSTMANIGCSIGFSVLMDTDTAAMALYERADFALYYAKQNGRGRPVIFSDTHEVALRWQSVLDQALRKADLELEMDVVFQPMFDASQNDPVACEALARWSNPDLGEVAPSEFIPVAERNDLISRLTHTLLRKTLACVQHWPEHIGVTFNLSVRDLIAPASILQIITIVNASGVSPKRIDFEVTETALMLDFEQAQTSIRALKSMGAGISLDDFGAGYSSLSYIHNLPLDKIKIDRSFVTDIESRDACRSIVKTVVNLCRDLGIACVVEGIESEAQASILRELGCDVMQGYHFSRPLAKDVVQRLLERQGNRGLSRVA